MAMPVVHIYSDGGYSRKHDAGGWATYIEYNNYDLMLTDYVTETTNNRMELQAAINALMQLTCQCRVFLYTDSMYVVNGLSKWLAGWVRNGWRTNEGKEVSNRDLWEQLCQFKQMHVIKPIWVKGHNGHPQNEFCDSLATQIQNIYGGYNRTK